ncbi:nucleotidyltransferase family protein [Pedobacter mucosus]|uniref:nucleotidyltransferase family protein n=1 Tax=Pedobacter mucosus TaxID=2895286 RepID=UPI001EE4AF12|nr:nucleotidyltransferase family protein [Pedobacter mucosus]UKT62259.1 nucleotidyltransferase family protein [Pedobacter mucosus]
MENTAIIILAAGNSSRLGKPKQLLQFQNKTLLQNVCKEAENAGLNPIIVVIGANDKEVENILTDQNISIIKNGSWQDGMSSSIIIGLTALTAYKTVENIVISVCDQPYINAGIFKALIEEKNKSTKGIVASAYANTLGTPVLFDKKYIKALQKLTGNDGAKKLLKIFQSDIAKITFLKGEVDIDTKTDYLNLLQQAE